MQQVNQRYHIRYIKVVYRITEPNLGKPNQYKYYKKYVISI